MKSFLGWLILLAALAVPAVLFWNWWLEMQGPAAAEGSAAPASFPGQTAPGGLEDEGQVAAAAASPSPAPEGMQPPSGEPAAPAPSGEGRTAGASEDGGPRAAASARRERGFNPRSNRDPMLSLLEIEYIAEQRRLEEEARLRALEAGRPKPKEPAPPVCSRILLQGIVTTPNGAGAIINDEVRYRGDKVLGARVTRITGTRVILNDRGQLCIKKVGLGG